jgi:hypothetical protein
MYCYLIYTGGGGKERFALRRTPANEFKFLFNSTYQDTVFWDVNNMKSGTKAPNFQTNLLPLYRTTQCLKTARFMFTAMGTFKLRILRCVILSAPLTGR